MQYNYIERVKNTGTEEDLMTIPGIWFRDRKLFKGTKERYIAAGIRRIKSYCEYCKLGRYVQGKAIVMFKELFKERKYKQQSLFNTEQRNK